MRKRTLLVALAALAVVGAAGVVVLWPRADRITEANLERIKEGMSRAEVDAILGGPPGDYRTGPTEPGRRTVFTLGPPPERWLADAGVAYVSFDDAGRVQDLHFSPNEPADIGPFDKLIWRLQRQWHRWFP
jgi:hypothetical protein